MTPQEALAEAIGQYVCGADELVHHDSIEDFASDILAVLPGGWELVDLPNFGKFILAERAYGAKHERERLLRLCGRDRDCECPIHHDLRLRE